jgi:hypothetical protein
VIKEEVADLTLSSEEEEVEEVESPHSPMIEDHLLPTFH